MAKKYLSVIVILFYSTAFANVYETDNNGIPTFSNVDTKGAKQVQVDTPQVVNSYNQISNGPSVNNYQQRRNEIVWKGQEGSSEERSSQDIRNLEGSLESFASDYESQDQSRR
jgi:guanylate kinase